MVYVLALLGAWCFALGSVLQQKGTLQVPAAEGDPHFLAQILRRPIWLAGGGLQVSGWVLQAAALDHDPLSVVQALTSMSLVIALPLGAWITDQRITRRVTLGAVAIVAGIVLLLAVGSPQGGTSTPPSSAWWTAGVSSALIIGILFSLGRRRHGATTALMFGSAAGVAYALQASVTKVFVTLIGQGISTMLSSWTIYALIASALVGFVLQQSALKTGVLAPAMAASNAVTLFISVVLGITLFGETLSHGNDRLAPAIIGLALALSGIILLAGAQPPEATAAAPRVPSRRGTSGSPRAVH